MRLSKLLVLTISLYFHGSCAINIEVTGQRTALEKQIIGTQKQLNQDLKLVTSVRAVDSDGSVKAKPKMSEQHEMALQAQQNQAFLQDDVVELKELGLLGESSRGSLMLRLTASGATSVAAETREFAEAIMTEENHNRKLIWQRLIAINPDIAEDDLGVVQTTYARQIFEASPIGYWFFKDGSWSQKK